MCSKKVGGARPSPGDAKALSNRAPHDIGSGGRRQRHEVDAVGAECTEEIGRRDRQPRLTCPSRARQRHQPHSSSSELSSDLGEFSVPSEDGRRKRRKIGGCSQALERRKVLLQAIHHQLEDVLWLGYVLEPVPSQVLQLHRRRPVPDQLSRRGRYDDLPTMCGCGDPGGPMNIHADVIALVPGRLTGMQSHSYPQGSAAGPDVGGESALSRQRCADGVGCGREDDEEAVPSRCRSRDHASGEPLRE